MLNLLRENPDNDDCERPDGDGARSSRSSSSAHDDVNLWARPEPLARAPNWTDLELGEHGREVRGWALWSGRLAASTATWRGEQCETPLARAFHPQLNVDEELGSERDE